jgi:hypothetical protein
MNIDANKLREIAERATPGRRKWWTAIAPSASLRGAAPTVAYCMRLWYAETSLSALPTWTPYPLSPLQRCWPCSIRSKSFIVRMRNCRRSSTYPSCTTPRRRSRLPHHVSNAADFA